jgi:sugar phosphate isomerase/epimerase
VDIVYEFMPFDVNVQTLDTALEVVQGAAQPNGGLAIDTWHMAKLGIEPDELRKVPLEYLMWVELSDGQWENMEDAVDEVVNHRHLPGEGEFPIRDYIAACRDVGYDRPWGVEVLSSALRELPIEEEFKVSYEATASQFSPAVA